VRNDAITPAAARQLEPQAIVISPGPCTPTEAGCSVAVISELSAEVPTLGVCLGHQSMAVALGGRIVRATQPRHGRTSLVEHGSAGLFSGVPSPFEACRYHSLVVAERDLPAEVRVTARALDDGCIMAIEHASRPLFGVQFHPEAVLTAHGYTILANFLAIAGCTVASDSAQLAATEHPIEPSPTYAPPRRPVTF
jgi:anthranilate synthase/aminodeoxychorismate synthase-like glutamine amidotransferase